MKAKRVGKRKLKNICYTKSKIKILNTRISHYYMQPRACSFTFQFSLFTFLLFTQPLIHDNH